MVINMFTLKDVNEEITNNRDEAVTLVEEFYTAVRAAKMST